MKMKPIKSSTSLKFHILVKGVGLIRELRK
jgi:hypothetical protein